VAASVRSSCLFDFSVLPEETFIRLPGEGSQKSAGSISVTLCLVPYFVSFLSLYANARDFLLAIGQQHFRPEAST
jgi:hypothetical protein